MIISIIAAIDERQAIGKDNAIPWRQQADMQRFKQLTSGHHVIMGRRTYESLSQPRVLPDRTMIVLSTTDRFARELPDHVIHHRSIFTAIEHAEQAGETELFLIGGWEVYMMGLMFADRMYLTRIETRTLGKVTKFPEIAWREWEQRQSAGPYPANDQNQYPYSFEVWERLTNEQVYTKMKRLRRQQYVKPLVSNAPMISIICVHCQKPFDRPRSAIKQRLDKGQTSFACSRSCANLWREHLQTVVCQCYTCKKSFKRAPSLVKGKQRVYCSVDCHHKGQKIR